MSEVHTLLPAVLRETARILRETEPRIPNRIDDNTFGISITVDRLDRLYRELLQVIQSQPKSSGQLRSLRKFVNSQLEDSFYTAQIKARIVLQAHSKSYKELVDIEYYARTVTELKRTLLAIANKLDDLAEEFDNNQK